MCCICGWGEQRCAQCKILTSDKSFLCHVSMKLYLCWLWSCFEKRGWSCLEKGDGHALLRGDGHVWRRG